uniref:Uncharacterized protein n=1 Tax=Arundo donax TaxID=35708 RepID=A0A0A9F2D0_ARUDO
MRQGQTRSSAFLTLEMLSRTPAGDTWPITVTFLLSRSMLNDVTPSILEICFLTFPAQPWQWIATFITTTWRTCSPGDATAAVTAGARLAAAASSRAGASLLGLLVTMGSVTATGALPPPRRLSPRGLVVVAAAGGGGGGGGLGALVTANRRDVDRASPPRRAYLTSCRARASSATMMRSARRATTIDRTSPGMHTDVAACDRHSIPPALMPPPTVHRAKKLSDGTTRGGY